jgi:hypothetical protein
MLSLAGSSERPQPTAPRTLCSTRTVTPSRRVPISKNKSVAQGSRNQSSVMVAGRRHPSSPRPVSLNSPDRAPPHPGLLSVFFNVDGHAAAMSALTPRKRTFRVTGKMSACANSRTLKSDWVFRSDGLLILRLRRFPNHQLKLMVTNITSKNTDFRVFAWLNLK